MAELLQDNWILLVIALVIGLLVAWWLFAASRRTTIERVASGDEGPARRNQALIDAPPATLVQVDPPMPPDLAGAGSALGATAVAMAEPPAARVPADGGPNELTRIKGLGPKLADQLSQLGVTSLAQIAAWDDVEIERIDAQLGRFQGRIRRDDWPGQARLLVAGDTAAYQAQFGKI
jgi:predicted flap endonuclease-1-like 5' DNA nuclease